VHLFIQIFQNSKTLLKIPKMSQQIFQNNKKKATKKRTHKKTNKATKQRYGMQLYNFS
jgi:hypothetical protein